MKYEHEKSVIHSEKIADLMNPMPEKDKLAKTKQKKKKKKKGKKKYIMK